MESLLGSHYLWHSIILFNVIHPQAGHPTQNAARYLATALMVTLQQQKALFQEGRIDLGI